MGKRPTPQQVEWQKAARERLLFVRDEKFEGRQGPLAVALGVSHTLVSLVARGAQPPTRNLMARLGAIEGVNPRWADTGEGEPFLPDARGTLPVSDRLLPCPPADHTVLMTGRRFSVPPAFDRPTCYFWQLPAGHPAAAVADWRLLPGDLLLLETAREVTSAPAAFTGKKCVLSGRCLDRPEPLYGAVTADEKARLVFSADRPLLRFAEAPRGHFECPDAPRPRTRAGGRRRRTVRDLDRAAARAAERAADPWHALPSFNVTHVLAVQLLMVRP